ncbi:hypothetical protein [Pseudarthrobacter sp. NIBRBAC000502770]|uniref:hypothetical protein n=1 Tax=Pseudarthrobacter sp. NIBRBAC000502770 TaxID=2590785 RepID=UPI0011402FB9|nr:hypothetical protein [Pseudarthrobacter sp. NIBRBAC000502770]QDG90701.1 hypothetical protein NIBR502770_20985 [Pseudarthrobacter sp. NIBRBAC000502770]
MAPAKDKPTVHASLTALRKEIDRPDPFAIALSNSKIITFPDLNAMESEASDDLLEKIESGRRNWEVLNEWLSPEDAEALRAEKLTRAELVHVMKAASKYYQDHYGTAGEGIASAS